MDEPVTVAETIGTAAAVRSAVRAAARANDTDRYLAALLAPRSVRDDLVTLAAFAGELARVPLTASEPLIGEIRLQWWWDVLEKAGAEGASGHPVADAVVGLVGRGLADKAALQAVVDACRDGLTAEPTAIDKVLAARVDATEGDLFRVAAGIVGRARGGTRSGAVSQDARAALYSAAQGFGLARMLCTLPVALARGRTSLAGLPAGARRSGPPPDVVARLPELARASLATARGVVAGLDADDRAVVGPAVLPAALIEPYLRAFETAGRTSGWAEQPIDITPLRRAWTLFKARHTGWL